MFSNGSEPRKDAAELKKEALRMQQDLIEQGWEDVTVKIDSNYDPFAVLTCSFSATTRNIKLKLYSTGVWNNGRFGGTYDDMLNDMDRRIARYS